jgi:transposase InsO family protein
VVSREDDSGREALARRVAWLEERNRKLAAALSLLLAIVRAFGLQLDERHASADEKVAVLGAISRAEAVLGRLVALRMIGLSAARYREWSKRALLCRLEDTSSCPRTIPQRLTLDERHAMRDLVEGERHRHLSIRSLALLAQRTGHVFASVRTWYALVRANGWRRPRERQYPEKCRVGIRANAPNEVWHVDVTILRLLDGSRVYLHAVLDNYSRRILAWRVERELSASTTREMLLSTREALNAGRRSLGSTANEADKVRVFTDGGSENVCLTSDAELAGLITRVIAQVEVSFSNSMIEAFWLALKHRWLYLHRLDTLESVRTLVAAYVADHNDLIPRVELGGRTPNEAYEGRPAPALEDACREARARRLEANRKTSCGVCDEPPCERVVP